MFPIENVLFFVGNGKSSECTCSSIHDNGALYNSTFLVFCFFGIIFNWMSLLILIDKEHKLAVFTYLTVYTAMDLLHTIILCLYVIVYIYLRDTSLFRLVELLENFCTEVLNTIRIIAMLSITLDRIVHLEMILGLRNSKKHSSQKRARVVMIITFVLCICANLPNLLMYKCGDVFLDPDISFLHSQFYFSYNWIYFPLFYLIPSFFLIIGNMVLIILLRRALQREHLKGKATRRKNFTLTITATVIILTFVVVQIPGYIAVRSHFISMAPSNMDANELKMVDFIIQIFRFVPALNSLANLFIYILLCPPFKRTLAKTLMDQRKKFGFRSSVIVGV
ncbi:uncharacterized protein LOC123670587 [Harmonia axyridis]|uniref:uncharacterized protein LOC123670587 n=1 Tax=Harmonia axyridis TaxID=115357 RepID=UPI001E27889C|nr:uncharacterized protein LOC123670587 [Harmonia axyridis]